jgi:ATP adenylyltransferase
MADGPQQLWAPWRAAYIKGKAAPLPGCLFCLSGELAPEARREGLVLAVSAAGLVMLNRYPYSGGHLMVSPVRHVASPEELPAEEHDALFRLLRESLVILKRELRPQGVNVGINLGEAAGAGIAAHLHIHLVPRWSGDANFMTAVGGVRVISEDLASSYDALAPHFAPLDEAR